MIRAIGAGVPLRTRALRALRAQRVDWSDVDAAARAVATFLCAELPESRVSVVRVDTVTGATDTILSCRLRQEPYLQGTAGPARSELFARAFRTGEPQRLPDVQWAELGALRQREPVRSELVVPIVTRRGAWGLVHLEHPRPHAFDPDCEEAVEILASHFAIALEATVVTAPEDPEVDRLGRRLKEVSALCALSERFARAGDLYRVLQRVTEGAAELMDCEVSTVLIRTPLDPETLEVVAATGTVRSVVGDLVPIDRSMAGWVTRNGVHRTTMDASLSPDAHRASGDRAGIRDTLIVPLRSADEVFGVLTVSNRRAEGAYTPDDVELLGNLANHAAAAIESSKILEALRKRLAESAAVAEVGRAVTGTLSLDDVLKLVVREAEALVSAGGAVVTLANGPETLEIVAATGLLRQEVGKSVAMDGSLAGWAIRNAKTVVTDDFTSDPRVLYRELGYGPTAVVPLAARGRVSGALLVARSAGGQAFAPEDLAAIQSLAAYAAVAIDNARLFAAQKETADVLRARSEELERAYAELRASQERLLVSEKMAALGRVTAGIAHEINSPLGGILNSLQLARSYAEEYRQSATDVSVTAEDHVAIALDIADTLRLAEGGAQKVAQFVRSIKEQTRATDEERQTRLFDPAAEIESTVAVLEHELGAREAKVRLTLARGLRIQGDPGKLGLILQNLLSNATDAYEGEPGEVRVDLYGEGDSVVLEVGDDGSGIPEEIRGRIFDYLFTTKEVGKGTGLGLALVHSVVTSHFGGEIRFESEPGRGSTFRIVLPRADVRVQPAGISTPPTAAASAAAPEARDPQEASPL